MVKPVCIIGIRDPSPIITFLEKCSIEEEEQGSIPSSVVICPVTLIFMYQLEAGY